MIEMDTVSDISSCLSPCPSLCPKQSALIPELCALNQATGKLMAMILFVIAFTVLIAWLGIENWVQ